MTPQSDTTARSEPTAACISADASAAAPRSGPSLLLWPTLVWFGGSLSAVVASISGASPAMGTGFLLVGAICYAATLASLLPIRNLVRAPVNTLATGLLATVAVRGGSTLCLLIPAINYGWIARDSVAVAIVLWYMAFLVTDLVVVHRFVSDALPVSVRPTSERTTC